ncbi:Cell wall synthesis protein KRE9 [Lachnellula suecica]|uniref:Cell wall synthesis protein KRE9 n=1 Tax=Lachnellula suecica TaxID=602035 RepID=A0A8T9C079_9HELO|nr:Cell wall synthesis protein KRE9 [Lachnellula suecica]
MRFSGALVVLATLAPFASAVPIISSPAAGASLPGGAAIKVTWADDGVAPAISALTTYQIFLYSGANASPAQLWASPAASFTAGNSASITIPLGTGGSTTNAYFLGLQSTATAGGTVTTYSSRFTLTGMTGSFAPAVVTANAAVTGTAGPPTVNAVASAAVPAAGTTAAGDFGIAYTLQTGLTRYAPMQPIPPTAITATATTPLYPTSAVQFASTYMAVPSILTTLTQPQTYSAASHANTAAPAAQPSDDMAKFLARWKD